MKKFLISILLAFLLMPAVTVAQTHYNLVVASGTETNAYVPTYAYYSYSFAQMIYHANEVGLDGTIDTIAFKVDNGSGSRNLTIHMAEVNHSTFSSGSDAVAASNFQQVFSGSVNISSGWVTIALDSAFAYADTADLVIAVLDGTGSWASGYPYYQGVSMTGTRSIYSYTDNSAYSLTTPPSSCNTTSFLPTIKLGISSYSDYCATPDAISISGIVDDEATITWHENGGSTEWELLISDTAVTDFADVSGVAAYDTSYNVNGLDGNTLYYVYVRAICGGSSYSAWSNASTFRSACSGSTSAPYFTNFEDLATGEVPNCWMQIQTGTSGAGSFPAAYAYAPNARNSNVYFEFESESGETEVVALPEMDNINTLQLSFYASLMTANFTFEVGVMEDSIFVPVDTVALTPSTNGNWARSYFPYTVYFSDYTGSGNRIAMRVTSNANYTLMMDDLTIEEIPNCLAPTNLRIDSTSSSWVALSWHENGDASEWEVLYDSVTFNPNTTMRTPVSAWDTSIVLNGLTGGTTYYAYVRANCGDYSPWAGPITFVPGHYNMGTSGSDTLHTCGAVIYDDGGEDDEYSLYSDFTLVIYPSGEDSIITFWGSTNLYAYYARLRIYEGVGTEGTPIWQSSSSTYSETIPYTRSYAGPITVRFTGGSYNYGYTGFELHTACEAGPACATVTNVRTDNVGASSVHALWNVTGTNFGTLSGYEVECIEVATSNTVTTATPTATNVTLIGLTANTNYKLRVRSACEGGDYGTWDSVYFTTTHMPCMMYDTSMHDTLAITGTGSTTTYNIPINNYYNYTYSQQLILNSEMSGSTVISGIDFNYAYSSPNTDKTNCTIYLANTNVNSLSSNFVPFDSSTFQMVYSGSMVCTNGWNHFEFTNPFQYDGSNLLVAVLDNSGGYNSSTYTFTAHNASGLARHIYNDGSAYDPTNVGSGNAATIRNDMRLHVAGCVQEATCARPTVIVDSVGTTWVDLSWAPGYQETSWDVEYRAEGDSAWTLGATASTTTYSFTTLVPDTRYYFRITALCSDTNMSTEVTTRTLCVPDTLPFIYGFETFPTSGTAAPSCWNKGTNYGYADYPLADSYNAHSGSMSLYMYSYGETYCYFVLPPFAAATDSLEVSFWAFSNSTADNAIAVGVMTDPDDLNTFTTVSTVFVNQLNTWVPANIRLDSYTGNGRRIAIMAPANYNDYIYLDDLTVDYIRPCDRVSGVSLDYVTPDSATIVWTDNGSLTYELEYGLSGFVSGTGTVLTSSIDTVVITGLTPNTAYDVYVRGICLSGDTANWSNAFSFRTSCLLLDSLPFTEGFETVPAGMGTDYSIEFIPCWTRSYDPNDSYYSPYVYDYASHDGSRSLYWYWDSYDNFNPVITLPAVDTNVLDITNLQVSFWAMNNSSYADAPMFLVGVMSDPAVATTFQAVDTVVATSESWTHYECPLDRYTGHGNLIAIKAGVTTGNGYWYAYLDDFTIDTIPNCMHVGDLAMLSNTSTSVTIGWTERGTSTEWEIAIDTAFTTTPTADTSVLDSTHATIGGLTSGTTYYIWVRALCGSSEASPWEGPIEVVPNSYTMVPNATDTIYMCGGVIYDDGGPNGTYSNSQNTTVVIMPTDSSALVSVSGISYTESTYDYLTIYDGIGASGTSLWDDYGVSSLTNFGPITSTTGPITLVFHSDGSVTYDGFTVHVDCIPTHCRVTGVMLNPATAESSTQLSLVWNNNGAIYYQLEYGIAGFTQGSGTTANAYTNNATIAGLTPMTTYDVYLRSICGVEDTGVWVKYTFQTGFCDGMTYVENYDASMSNTTSSYGPIGYSTYNYSYVQTIIDSAHLADLSGDITAFAFQPSNTDASSYFTNMTVYMSNVPESDLSAGYIHPDSTHQFVKVIDSANFNYTTTDWQMHVFDTTFTWDGHSNILFAVHREHGSWSSGASFKAHSTSTAKTRYSYQDSGPYDYTTIGSGYTLNSSGDIRLFSCNASACPQPTIVSTTNNYESATITWTGDGNNYEVNIKESAATTWPTTDIAVTGNTYTFNGLQPTTSYTFRVRQDCNADSAGYSEWTIDGFTTDSLPCFAPDSLHVTAVTNSTATFDWTPVSSESAWEIHVWYSGSLNDTFAINTRPATISGLNAGVTYQAAIRALCGSAHNIEGDWGDTITFTTAVCPDVTGLGTRNVTANSVDVYWNPDPMAQQWIIEYGFHGFDLGTGTQVTTSLTTYTINGLIDDMEYDFRVRAVCGDNWQSEGWATTSATTLEGGVPCDAPTAVNAVAAGNAVTVSWTANTGNLSFVLEYGTRGFALGSGTTVNATASPVTISNLAYETAYDVYVKANCADNTSSAWSAVASFTTEAQGSEDCDPVTDLAATNVTESAALLTWTPGNSGDEWEVVLTTAAGATVSENSTTERQFQLTGLTPGTAYVAKVRTVCGDGQYSDFASVSFTTNSVGIADVTAPACTIYPNPTSGATTVSVSGISGKVRIAIVDMNGREVTSETLDCSGDCAKTMSVDNLAQGAYFVRITGENANMVRKLIVR